MPRDTHGDLRLDHVYFFPDRRPPDDLVIVDCIEFDERFRHADPVADMAFLAMDFALHGRTDLGRAFAEAYFRASGDAEGRTLLPFYAAYRAAVRGKVEGMKHGGAGDPRGRARRRPSPRPAPSGCWPSASWRTPAGGPASSWSGACPARASPPWPAAWPSGPASP